MLSEEHYENERTDYKQLQRQTIQGVITAVEQGELAEAVLDQALRRVLQLRYQLSRLPARGLTPTIAGDLEQTAAAAAVRLLRNQAALATDCDNMSELGGGFCGRSGRL